MQDPHAREKLRIAFACPDAMPELPEVETVRRGLSPHILNQRLLGAHVRESRLRWPVPDDLNEKIRQRTLLGLTRRGKYLLFDLGDGGMIVHLGMSGSLRLTPCDQAPDKHEHLDLLLEDGQCLRFRDPRRFGAVLWCPVPQHHPLLAHLGMEPLDPEFDGNVIYHLSRGRSAPIKTFIMNARLIVGVGNIYANESLFLAGIDPRLPAGRLSRKQSHALAHAIQETLLRAIAAGGSSLRDFVNGHGQPGYFQQSYAVYGRTGEPCRVCGQILCHITQGARSSFYCPNCQKRR